MYKFIPTILILLSISLTAHSQVLLALIFGDKLNSDKMEFGITLGNNFGTISNISESEWRLKGLSFGLFFNIKLNDRIFIHTGAIPKSKLGLRSIPPYKTGDPLTDPLIDSLDFNVERSINYIHVPILIRFRLFKEKGVFFEVGPQVSLRTKASDIFTAETNVDITLENSIKDDLRRFDVSAAAGILYKFKKMTEVGVTYNQGFLDIHEGGDVNRNMWVMVYGNIAIGAGKNKKGTEPVQVDFQPEKTEKEKKEKKKKKKD